MAKRERDVVIDPPEDDAEEVEYIDCQISVSQLDKIYAMLPGRSKAAAVLNGVEDLD